MEPRLIDGLKVKYNVYKASDGTMVNNCFVLRPDKDPAAVIALQAYAQATDNLDLSKDILHWVGKAPAIDPVHAAGACYCRECQYYRKGGCYREHDKYAAWEAEDPATRTNNAPIYYGWKPTDFCSFGERKQGELL